MCVHTSWYRSWKLLRHYWRLDKIFGSWNGTTLSLRCCTSWLRDIGQSSCEHEHSVYLVLYNRWYLVRVHYLSLFDICIYPHVLADIECKTFLNVNRVFNLHDAANALKAAEKLEIFKSFVKPSGAFWSMEWKDNIPQMLCLSGCTSPYLISLCVRRLADIEAGIE